MESLPSIVIETPDYVTELPQASGVDLGGWSISALANGASFVGDSTNISIYPSLSVNLFTDRGGVLYVDFSSDGKNWDHIQSFVYVEDTSFIKQLQTAAKYYRVRFINNSGADQSIFRLQAIPGNQVPKADVTLYSADNLLSRHHCILISKTMLIQ